MKVDRWVGQPVYKLAEDGEMQIEGTVLSFCPSSRQYLLQYGDGTTQGVPVGEIEDYVPLVRQLPVGKRHSLKKRRVDQGRDAVQQPEETTPTVKRARKVVACCVDEELEAPLLTPEEEDESAGVVRFVQDTLWPLTATLNISADRKQALLDALDNRNKQPLATLAQFASEGGVDIVSNALNAWVSRVTEGCAVDAENEGHRVGDDGRPRQAAIRSPRRTPSPCSQHLFELMTGKCPSVLSPKPTKAKEPHISPTFRGNGQRRAHPPTAPFPVVVDLTVDPPSDEDEEEEEEEETEGEEEDNAASSGRIRFGRSSTILFGRDDTVNDLLQRAGYKNIKVPTQNPEAWKSVLKPSTSVNALLGDPRMREIAKQMGLQPEDFGQEAQVLWQTLNDLSTSDPKRYESFINEQLQDGRVEPS